MISLCDISIGYSAPLVTSIGAELLSGKLTCLVGRNGTGKSTLLKTIAQLIPPLDGKLSLNGHRTGIVLTHFPDLSNTTVYELVSYGRLPHQNLIASLRPSDHEAINEALTTVGINQYKDRLISRLSDGEKQKVMIARALAQGTDTLLLDEPSAFLDYPSKVALMKLLKDLARCEGKAILLSTHDVELAKAYADCIWHLKDGKLQTKSPSDFNIDEV